MTCLDKNGKILAVGDVVSYRDSMLTISKMRPSASYGGGRHCVEFYEPVPGYIPISGYKGFVYNIYLTKDTFMSDVRDALEGAQTHDAIDPRKEN